MRHALRTRIVTERPAKERDEECPQFFPILPPGTSRDDLIKYGSQTALNGRHEDSDQDDLNQIQELERP